MTDLGDHEITVSMSVGQWYKLRTALMQILLDMEDDNKNRTAIVTFYVMLKDAAERFEEKLENKD